MTQQFEQKLDEYRRHVLRCRQCAAVPTNLTVLTSPDREFCSEGYQLLAQLMAMTK